MPTLVRCFLLLVLLLLCGKGTLVAQNRQSEISSSFSLHADLPYVADKKIYQGYYLISPQKIKIKTQIKCYWYKSETDSILIFKNTNEGLDVKQGLNTLKTKIGEVGPENYILPSFSSAAQKTGIIPPGIYKLQFVLNHDDIKSDSFAFMYVVDSGLSIESNIGAGLRKILMPLQDNFTGHKSSAATSQDKASFIFSRSQNKLARYFKKKGLILNQYTKNSKEIIDLYFETWFMGRYEMDSKASVSAEISKEQNALQNNVGSMAKNELGNYQSLMSQFRELKKESKDKDEIEGQVALAGNYSNGQEPNSTQDNNYYEATGAVALPLFNIPFNVSGYYTSQDKHRDAKASYVHLSYDADKAKEQLLKLITSYNKRYAQTLSQNGNYQMIYGEYLDELEQQKATAIESLKQETGITDFNASSFNTDAIKDKTTQLALSVKDKALDSLSNITEKQKDKLEDSLSTASSKSNTIKDTEAAITKAKETKQRADEAYVKAMEKYNKIMELNRKIEKYRMLLNQYNNTMFYDSLMTYSKLADIKDAENMSYKDMAKKASSILPDGKVKSVITGLTNFDAGMFPKYVSNYTMSGQMLKGLDLGYDIGFANVGGSYGKTQYIDHDGAVEDYKMYSMRAQFKPLMHQRFGVVYMGYSPSAKLLESPNFLKDIDFSVPNFKKPVQIIAATYTGEIGRYLALTGEYAISNQSAQPEEAQKATSFTGKSAYNIKAIGNIPSTLINIEAGYEHTGSAFENNTLPVIMAGTEKVEVSAKGDFFRSFLCLGIDYNYLIQNSFYSKGSNSKWGFDIATHSKRFPSVSLSYKPFSTFRSLNDTLAVAQKPIVGEVWIGKASYQIKKLDKAIRFMLMYNLNSSIMDTVNYNSSLIQFSTILSQKTTMLSLSFGRTVINADYIITANPNFNKSQFVNVTASGNILENVILTGGTDIAGSKIGLSRYGLFTGVTYSFTKIPLMLRCNMRYSNYRLDEIAGWKPLYFGGIELAYKFKMKMWD